MCNVVNHKCVIIASPALSLKIKVISFVAAVFVVFQHCSYGYHPTSGMGLFYQEAIMFGIASFPVYFFMMVSGFFFVKRWESVRRSWLPAIRKRIRSLIVPYFVWCSLSILLNRSYFSSDAIGWLRDYGLASWLPYLTSMWYVRTLFVFCLVSPLLILLLNKCSPREACLLSVFGGVALLTNLPANKAIWGPLFFFSVGLWQGLRFNGVSWGDRGNLLKNSDMIVLFAAMLIKAFDKMLFGYDFVVMRYVVIIATCSVMWRLYDIVSAWSVFKRIVNTPQISEILSTSFYIYCAHRIVIPFVDSPCKRMFSNFTAGWIYPILLCVVVVGCSLFSYWILRQMFPWGLMLLTGGRSNRTI